MSTGAMRVRDTVPSYHAEGDPQYVRPGYKRTEVGVFPKDWEVDTLRSLLSQPATYGIVKAGHFVNSGVPMVRGGDIKDGRISLDLPNVTHAKSDEFKRTKLQAGDVLVALVGYPGEAAVCPSELEGANISRAVGLLRPRAGSRADYIVAYLNSPIGRREFLKPGAGSAQLVVNLRDLNSLRLPLPHHAEERAIAEALSDADGLLAALEALIAKKRAIKQAAMQQLLTGKTRLPGFSGEWVTKRLGEVGTCLRGVSYDPASDLVAHDTATTVRLLRANNVESNSVSTADLHFVESRRVTDKQLLRMDDVLICTASGSKEVVGKAAQFRIEDGYQYTFGAFMGCFRTDRERASPVFVFCLFQTSRYRAHVSVTLAGSSINNLSPADIEATEFRMPQRAEQDEIANVLSDMDAEIACLEARRDKTRAIKQGMMQQLLTGRIRLAKPSAA